MLLRSVIANNEGNFKKPYKLISVLHSQLVKRALLH